MDGRRFDTISRLLAGAGTRRGALKAALGLMAGGSALAAGEVAARPALCRPAGRYCTHNRQCCGNRCRTGKRVPIASRNICDCTAPQAMCGKMCRDLSSDPNHCGACGNQIDRETELCCDGVPTAIDEHNCHACGNVCGPDDVCCGPEIGCAASCEPDEPDGPAQEFCATSTAAACLTTSTGGHVELCDGPLVPGGPCVVDSDCVQAGSVGTCTAKMWVAGEVVDETLACVLYLSEFIYPCG